MHYSFCRLSIVQTRIRLCIVHWVLTSCWLCPSHLRHLTPSLHSIACIWYSEPSTPPDDHTLGRLFDTASPSATPLATWSVVFDTATTTSPPLSRSLPLCQPEEFDLDLVLYLLPIPVVHSEVWFPFKWVHQLLTNSLFQSAAQNLLVADEAIDVFTKADAEGEMKKINKMKKDEEGSRSQFHCFV